MVVKALGSACLFDLQDIHGQVLRHSLSDRPDGASSLDAATLPLPVRQAAFVEAADCFAALIAKPEVRVTCCCTCSSGMLVCVASHLSALTSATCAKSS